jgi:dienelactone hydrolase
MSDARTRTSATRFVLALAEDADRVRLRADVVVIDEIPGVVLAEAERAVAADLAKAGEYVAVYTSLADAHRAFALFQPAS